MDAEDSVRAARLNAAMTASGIGQWSLDIASGRLVASDVFRALLHRADDDHLTETHLLEAVHPEDRAVFIDCLSSSVESGRPFQLIHRVVTDDQAARTVDTRGLIIVDDAGHPIRVAAVVLEVDEPSTLSTELQGHNQSP